MSIHLLVFNCGSSSLNYQVFLAEEGQAPIAVGRGKAHRVGVRGTQPAFLEHHLAGRDWRVETPLPDHATAARHVLRAVQGAGLPMRLVGHRFVHGGERFHSAVWLDERTLAALEECLPLAPIHNPAAYSVIAVCRQRLPGAGQTASFDTAFHAGLPAWAREDDLPAEWKARAGLRRYGFHGLSLSWVTRAAARWLARPLAELSLIVCHLGTGGSSVTAVQGGQSVDTSMGFSPLAGLVMSTRPGDLDPLLPSWLARTQALDGPALNRLFNQESGLRGVSGLSSDLRDLLAAQAADPRAGQAVALYLHRLRRAIGAYAALLGRPDALIFTDDIGLWLPEVRAAACSEMDWCGIRLDEQANQAAPLDQISELSAPGSRVRILAAPTNEEAVIAQEAVALWEEARRAGF